MRKTFFRHVLPAMLAFAFSGLYTIVDGFFIGRSLGDAGLAAINIAFPLAALLQAVGTGIGMGGAIQSSVSRGRGDKAREQRCLGCTLALLALAGLALTAVLLFAGGFLLTLLGANAEMMADGRAYLSVIAVGALFQVCATGLTPLLRNLDGHMQAMAAMMAGFCANIVLDALLVPRYGMAGAAWATVTGQLVTVIPCAVFLARRLRLPRAAFLPGREAAALLASGFSPFGLTMSPFLVIILMNKSAAAWGGASAVAAYAVISYAAAIIQLLLQGVGDGSQPLMSLYAGMGETDNVFRVRNYSYGFSTLTAALAIGATFALRGAIPVFFGASGQVAAQAAGAFPVILSGFLFFAFCRTTTSYFYATGKNRAAYAMVYGEPAILCALLPVLPRLLGLPGVWAAMPAAQLLLALTGFLLLKRGAAAGKLPAAASAGEY